MAEALERLVNRTAQNIRWSAALHNDAQAVRQAAINTRREAMVLCRFSALERRRRAMLSLRQAKPSLVSYFVL